MAMGHEAGTSDVCSRSGTNNTGGSGTTPRLGSVLLTNIFYRFDRCLGERTGHNCADMTKECQKMTV